MQWLLYADLGKAEAFFPPELYDGTGDDKGK